MWRSRRCQVSRTAWENRVNFFPGWPTHRPECIRQMEHAKKDLEKLGVTVEVVDIGEQTCNDGSKLPLPPILLGQLGQERRFLKKTASSKRCIFEF